jgi:hypothetical protein
MPIKVNLIMRRLVTNTKANGCRLDAIMIRRTVVECTIPNPPELPPPFQHQPRLQLSSTQTKRSNYVLKINNTSLPNWNTTNSGHLLEIEQNSKLLRQLLLFTHPFHLYYPTARIRDHQSFQHTHPECNPNIHHPHHSKTQHLTGGPV